MRVTGERKTTYRLLDTPVRQGYDGVVYRVDGGTMGGMQTFVKLYPSAMRTDQERNKVIDAVNGRGGIMGPRPIEPVYERGKFAGYAFQEETDVHMPPPPPPPAAKAPVWLLLVETVVFGMVASLVIRFVIMGMLQATASELCYTMLNNGTLLSVGGFVAGLIGAVLGSKADAPLCYLAGPVFYVVGAFVVFTAVSLLALVISAVTVGASIAAQLLPTAIGTIVILGVVVYLLKSLLR